MHGLPEDVPMRPKTPLIWHLARRGGALSEETDVIHHPSSVIHRPSSIVHSPSSIIHRLHPLPHCQDG